VMLIVTGLGIALHSFEMILHAGSEVPSSLALIAAFVSIVVKEFLYQITMAVARKERSEVLIANAWHHRSDAISSIVAFIGVGGSILGWKYLDPVAGIIVAALISKAGYDIFSGSVKELTDNQSIEQSTIENISALIKEIPDVLGHHNLRSRKMGPYSLVDFHITVDPQLSVTAAHQIAERTRRAILSKFPHIREALIHVEGAVTESVESYPEDFKILPSHATVVADIKRVLKQFPEVITSGYFAIHYLGEEVHAIFSIRLDPNTTVSDLQRAPTARMREEILQQVPYLKDVSINLELD